MLSLIWKRREFMQCVCTFCPCQICRMQRIYIKKRLLSCESSYLYKLWFWIRHACVKPGRLTMNDHHLVAIWKHVKTENMSKGLFHCLYVMVVSLPNQVFFKYPQGMQKHYSIIFLTYLHVVPTHHCLWGMVLTHSGYQALPRSVVAAAGQSHAPGSPMP